MENKKITKRPDIKKLVPLKIELWNLYLSDNRNKIITSLKILRSRLPFRLTDTIIIIGLFTYYELIFAFCKHFGNEGMRTTYPYKPVYKSNLFAWVHDRQPKEPFLYKPHEDNARDYEQFITYQERKNKLLNRLQQQHDLTILATRLRCTSTLDNKELDFSDYQTMQKINYDFFTLSLIRKSVNDEFISMGLKLDPLLYAKERVNYDYKSSKYKYKEELYKELKSLIDI